MSLFYDESTHRFSVEKTETNECVFLSYDGRDEHIGWSKKNNETTITKANITIKIQTNFWPEKVKCEFFYANIYINDILLRPLFQCYNNGRFSKPSHTIEMTHEDFEWAAFLSEICNVCNYSNVWLNSELEKLLSKLSQDSLSIEEQIKVLNLLRDYDSTNPYFVEKYRNYFDSLLFDKEIVLPLFERIFTQSECSSIETFDVIWHYIRDYKLA